MVYGKLKDLAKRTQSDKALRDKALSIASDPKYDGYQRGLASMVHKFLNEKSSGSGAATSLANKSATEPNYQFANEKSLENLRNEKFIHLLETIFGV